MKKALQILNTGIDALQKSILFSDDENYKEMVVAEIAEYKEAIAELEELENRSCFNCKFNSNIDKACVMACCDKHRQFINQHQFKYCGCYELKEIKQ